MFERAVYGLSMSIGKRQKLSYYQQSYATHVRKMCLWKDPLSLLSSVQYRRRWKKLWSVKMDDIFCPSFELWWVRREEADLSDWEELYMPDNDCCGFRKRMKEIASGQLTTVVGLADG